MRCLTTATRETAAGSFGALWIAIFWPDAGFPHQGVAGPMPDERDRPCRICSSAGQHDARLRSSARDAQASIDQGLPLACYLKLGRYTSAGWAETVQTSKPRTLLLSPGQTNMHLSKILAAVMHSLIMYLLLTHKMKHPDPHEDSREMFLN